MHLVIDDYPREMFQFVKAEKFQTTILLYWKPQATKCLYFKALLNNQSPIRKTSNTLM